MRQRNRTSSSSAHSANAALNAKITNSSRLADYLPKVLVFQKLSTLGQKLRRPVQSHANQTTYLLLLCPLFEILIEILTSHTLDVVVKLLDTL